MGQQQLLLVILVTIIVGIATVVAINTFGTAADQANIDAVNNDIATLASAAQGYYMRPDMLGGGGRTFNGITFEGLAFPSTFIDDGAPPVAVNENGRYELDDIGGQAFTIRAYPASSSGYEPAADPTAAASTGGEPITAAVGPNTFELGATASELDPPDEN
jgi:type II secretory pathway pseudopilin PulG